MINNGPGGIGLFNEIDLQSGIPGRVTMGEVTTRRVGKMMRQRPWDPLRPSGADMERNETVGINGPPLNLS